jgi:putative membrane protein
LDRRVVRLLFSVISTALAVAAASWMFDGIGFEQATTGDKILPLVVVAVILGAINAVVKPILTVLSIPFIVVTLGLFLLVINAAMLKLTEWFASDVLDLGFFVHGFWTAIGGALVITVVNWFVNSVFGDD